MEGGSSRDKSKPLTRLELLQRQKEFSALVTKKNIGKYRKPSAIKLPINKATIPSNKFIPKSTSSALNSKLSKSSPVVIKKIAPVNTASPKLNKYKFGSVSSRPPPLIPPTTSIRASSTFKSSDLKSVSSSTALSYTRKKSLMLPILNNTTLKIPKNEVKSGCLLETAINERSFSKNLAIDPVQKISNRDEKRLMSNVDSLMPSTTKRKTGVTETEDRSKKSEFNDFSRSQIRIQNKQKAKDPNLVSSPDFGGVTIGSMGEPISSVQSSVNFNFEANSDLSERANSYLDLFEMSSNVEAQPVVPKFEKKVPVTVPKEDDFPMTRPEFSLKDFEFVEKLGSGAFGKVFLVQEKKSKLYFAMKAVERALLKNDDLLLASYDEVDVQSKMDHPNIVDLYTIFEDAKHIYLIMELAGHGDMFKYLEGKPTSKKNAANILKMLLRALDYLHSSNLIHRDVKLENMLISNNHEILLADFGQCANMGRRRKKFTGVSGTKEYLCPERINGTPHNEKTDIWAAGVVAFELLTGELPFGDCSPDEYFRNACIGAIQFPPGFDKQSEEFIRWVFKIKCDERPSAVEILEHPFIVNNADRIPYVARKFKY